MNHAKAAPWALTALLACTVTAFAVASFAQDAPQPTSATTAASTPENTETSLQTVDPASAASATAGGDIPLAPADAAAVRVPSAADAWGGPRTGEEATLSDRVVTYRIQATLDPEQHTIDGRQQLTWRNRSQVPVDAVYLHLYLNAFSGPGSTFFTEMRKLRSGFRSGVDTEEGDWGYMELRKVEQAGQPVPWTFVHPDGGPETDRTVVRLDLPQPVAPGASTTLDIAFFDQLPRVTARTGYFDSFHLVAQWFPKIAVLELPGERGATTPRWNAHEFHLHSEFYADFGLFDVRLTVPEEYTIGATGKRQGDPVIKDGMATHHYVQGDVHDFAWTAYDRYAQPLTEIHRTADGKPVLVTVLYPPEYEHNAQPVLQATLDALEYFGKTLGEYPYDTVTAVIPPHNAGEAGGMEYPTFFTASSYEEVPPGSLSRYRLDFVTIHEFGHGYFYGILASNEFEEPWLDEGLNSYWNQRQMLAREQHRQLAAPWLRQLGVDIPVNAREWSRMAANLDAAADGLGQNSWNRLSSRSYSTVYSRTAVLMSELESRLGSAVMERAFQTYYQRWKFRHPSSADLREVLTEVSGRRQLIEHMFARHVYDASLVDDRIVSLYSREVLPQPGLVMHEGERVELTDDDLSRAIADKREAFEKAHPDAEHGPFPYRTQVTLRREGVASPRSLRVDFADGSHRIVRWDNGREWARFEFLTRSRAVSARLDPDSNAYMDANPLNDSRSMEPDDSTSRSWSADLAALLQTFYALLVSL